MKLANGSCAARTFKGEKQIFFNEWSESNAYLQFVMNFFFSNDEINCCLLNYIFYTTDHPTRSKHTIFQNVFINIKQKAYLHYIIVSS